jgi:hypothetical protein
MLTPFFLSLWTGFELTLHFAELYWPEAGQRIFNFKIEDKIDFVNMDVVARAGSRYTSYTYRTAVIVSDVNS